MAETSLLSWDQLDALPGDVPHSVISIYCASCGYSHAVTLNCGDRLCRDCSARRYGRLMNHYKEFFSSLRAERLRFVTLTIRNQKSLELGLCHLQKSIKRLLRKVRYRRAFVGGVIAYQVTWNSDRCDWHVHAHLIVTGKFVPQEILKKDWLSITGDSYVVGISAVESGIKALKYVLAYSMQNPGDLRQSQRDEFNRVFFGKRMLQPFGSWFGAMKKVEVPFLCPVCGGDSWISEFWIDQRFKLLDSDLGAPLESSP